MQDLVEKHRENIAHAGSTLAKIISDAMRTYAESVAASELELQLGMETRLRLFKGEYVINNADSTEGGPSLPKAAQLQVEQGQ